MHTRCPSSTEAAPRARVRWPWAITLLAAATVAAGHGSAHLARPVSNAPLVDASGEPVPAYLVAAVCGLPGQRGERGFEQRLALAHYLLAQATTADDAPPLFEGLGDHHRRVSTATTRAQAYFDQGLMLAYAFNFPEALVSFRHARRLDPECAMCWWGEAYVLGPNINAPMDPEAEKPAREAIDRALAASSSVTPVERALIDALAARYGDEDRSVLNQRFAAAMARAAARFPKDADVLAIYADALMNTRPWDYWEHDGTTLYPELRALVPTLEQALALNEGHPLAVHLYIHAVEASKQPQLAAPHADALVSAAPGAGHLVHMPSHLYIRLGRYEESIRVNRLAMAADEAYLAQKQEETPYRYTYYPHNVHFVLESARAGGDGEAALEAADKLAALMSAQMSEALPWVQLMEAAPYLAHAQFSPPARTLALARPPQALPYVVGAWQYARGSAFVQSGQLVKARESIVDLRAFADIVDWDEAMPDTPAEILLRIGALVLEGRVLRGEGRAEEAVERYREAVSMQDGLPYLEPPMWYYPVRQSLGAALLEARQAAEARAVFERGLDEHPQHALLLYGLWQSLSALQLNDEAVAAQATFERLWLGDGSPPVLSDL